MTEGPKPESAPLRIWRDLSGTARGWIIAGVLFALLAIGGAIIGPQHDKPKGDPATLLASDDSSSDTAAYSSALDVWAAKCTQDRVASAGLVDSAYRDEQTNHGSDTSRLQVMRNLSDSVPASSGPTDCTAIAAAYLILVEPTP